MIARKHSKSFQVTNVVVDDHATGYMTCHTSTVSNNDNCCVNKGRVKEMKAQKALCIYGAEVTIRKGDKMKVRF
jgi:hypothetical protein